MEHTVSNVYFYEEVGALSFNLYQVLKILPPNVCKLNLDELMPP